MVKIKFCGITNPKDALWASNLGVDYIGINFVKSSPRKVSVKQAQKIINSIPEFVKTVLVFANQDIKEILKISKRIKPDYIQLHGDEDLDFIKRLNENGVNIIKTVKIGEGEEDFQNYQEYSDFVSFFLLDRKSELLGGTGESFNWDKAIRFKEKINKPFFLAGGLNPENVKDAIEKVKPFGVDVASGIEKFPRSKDYKKMQEFIRNVQKAK